MRHAASVAHALGVEEGVVQHQSAWIDHLLQRGVPAHLEWLKAEWARRLRNIGGDGPAKVVAIVGLERRAKGRRRRSVLL